MGKLCIGSAVLATGMLLSTAAMADGIMFPLEADSGDDPLTLFSQNSNDGYSGFRGVIFQANEDVSINGAYLWTKSLNGLNATFELYTLAVTEGNVLAGATLERTSNYLLQGDIGFHGGKFDAFDLIAGRNYLIRVGYTQPADENWFFAFDQGSEDPLDLGPITIIDGTASGHSGNTVTPFMSLQIVPAPGAMALLGLAAVVGRRRRRA